MCEMCSQMTRQDALTIKTLEITETIHNACAPVTHYAAKCRTCGTKWLALEVYDEEGRTPSEWSWSVDKNEAAR